MISHIDYEALGCERSKFDKIFLSLTSRFRTFEELRKGEEIIRENIEEFISCYKIGWLWSNLELHGLARCSVKKEGLLKS